MAHEEAGEDVLCSGIFKIDEIPAKGVSGCLEVEDRERAVIARALDLPSLDTLRMEFRIRRSGRGRFELAAHMVADFEQSCVLTLDPVADKINEQFTIEFWPPQDVAQLEAEAEKEGMEVPLEGPEPIVEGRIDVGQLTYEHFAAALELYPRKSGASFDWRDPRANPDSGADGKPFAVLASLKRPKDTGSD